MELEQLVLGRLMETYTCIQTPEQARSHLDVMTNSEFLLVLSSAVAEILEAQPILQT